jgi:predicted nucleic acid-binding OB-fold protein
VLDQQFSYLDLKNNLVYLNGVLKSENQKPLALAINYEAPKLIDQLRQEILTQFEQLIADSDLKMLHFFNLTGDVNYLIQELENLSKNSYQAMIAILNRKFELTKANH